ncbi:MAG: putative porin, partial [Xanthomonadales bacterium]|nr:putative porin [Xanthomonadales bacterium]
RAQVEALTRRLDELERQNEGMARSLEQAAPKTTAAANAPPSDDPLPDALDRRIAEVVSEQVDSSLAAVSWAERLRWRGDFRYRYENIGVEGQDDRNRSRIRARTHLEAQVTPTVEVGIGLATGGDDPVSSNVTIGGGGARKEIGLDLAYFDWSGLAGTHVLGGTFSNFLVSPQKTGLLWDGDWRPEGLGLTWQNGMFFAQGLGTWLEGDSRSGTEFAWVAQAGVNLAVGGGQLMFGGGYSLFDIAGSTPLYGDPDDFFGNSYVLDPDSGDLVFANDYHEFEAFAEYRVTLGGRPLALFADYVVNTEAAVNDTGYLFGARYGSAKARGTWDLGWFYKDLEADAVVGLLTDSDFGGGGTDARGHVFQGAYAFHDNWNFSLTYFLNETGLASGDPQDFDRVQLDLNFKYQ